ncbi:MAG: DEAD/DEAH box helicase [Pirellulales bacterium]
MTVQGNEQVGNDGPIFVDVTTTQEQSQTVEQLPEVEQPQEVEQQTVECSVEAPCAVVDELEEESIEAELSDDESSDVEASDDELSDDELVEEAVSEDTGLKFRDLKLNAAILESLEKSGYTTPTPIQAETIPLLLAGRDVLGQAQTGTGKTAAFALPMLQRIDLAVCQPQVLVLAPTRELAIQVADAFKRYASKMPGLRVAAIYGGQDYTIQFRALDRGVHVVVGTPGRVMDHMRRESLKLDKLQGLVLDEADEMLRMGFADDVEWVLSQSPAERQIALFSATLPEPIRQIAHRHLRNPAQITIAQKTATADTIRQRYVIAQPNQKDEVLSRILETETIDGVIVFVKMKSTTEPLAEFLNQRGHRAAALNGDIPQAQRERIVNALKSGKLDVLVATDVAARGLDVNRISHVVNFDLPFDSEAYVHRIGRTGRAGRQGEAVLIVSPREQGRLRRLEQATRHAIEPMSPPSNRAINKRRVTKFHERITAALARPELQTFTSIVEQYLREHETPMEQIAAALAILANGDAPLFVTEELQPAQFPERRGRFRDERGGREPRGFERRGHESRGHESRGFEGRGHETRGFQGRGFEERGGEGRERRPSGRRQELMQSFRIEVGHAHQVKAGNIVGAIANETGLESQFIGRIAIFDDFSIVDLPARMPREVFFALKKVRVAGRPINPSRVGGGPPPQADKRFTKKRKFRDRPDTPITQP